MRGVENGQQSEGVKEPDYLLYREILENHEIEGVLNDSLKTYYFDKGSHLEQIRDSVSPKLKALWADALNRDIDDNLVIEDSGLYPFKEDKEVILVENDREEFVGIYTFFPFHFKKLEGVNVNICLLKENYQGKGVIPKLIDYSFDKHEARFFCLRTQNARMVKAMRKFCPEGYMFPIDDKVAGGGLELARDVSVGEDFDDEVLVERGLYAGGKPLYGDSEVKLSSDERINEYFNYHVNYHKGDALLLIGVLRESNQG